MWWPFGVWRGEIQGFTNNWFPITLAHEGDVKAWYLVPGSMHAEFSDLFLVINSHRLVQKTHTQVSVTYLPSTDFHITDIPNQFCRLIKTCFNGTVVQTGFHPGGD